MSKTVFIDGAAGTTGLRIHKRLEERADVKLLVLSEDKRKNLDERVKAAQNADVSILCLPDAASAEIAAALGTSGRIVDASTAHRTKTGWVYGLPELHGTRERLENASRVSVPGCYASGFNLLVAPLVKKDVLPKNTQLYMHGISGYSGAGKSAIEQYESADKPAELNAPRQYALGLKHKHLAEMQHVSGVQTAPVFMPVICNYYSGMLVSLPVNMSILKTQSLQTLADFYADYYAGEKLINVHKAGEGTENGFVAANKLAGKDNMEIFIHGNEQEALLMARYDNLGKGASGACIQCMNIMLGFDETQSLIY